MDFDLDAEQRAWLAEVREFLRENVTDALRAEIAEHNLEHPGGEVAAFRAKLGARGWFGLNRPGGYGRADGAGVPYVDGVPTTSVAESAGPRVYRVMPSELPTASGVLVEPQQMTVL